MSYVDRSLIPGEKIVYRASLNSLPFLWLIVPVVVAFIAAVFHRWLLTGIFGGITGLLWLRFWARRATAEFAVTDKRVIVAVGAIRRRTLELMLDKVEGIGVEQTLAGRIFNFGTVTITGSGGTRESFDNIAAPLEFRRQVQAQLAARN
jgi:uncharacterized membrane protein YdbT with pleckstrin-like domain